MRYASKNQCHRRSGIAIVEFALLLPFLTLMFTAAVDYARIYQATQILQDAATVGASYAAGYHHVTSVQGRTNTAIANACLIGATLPQPLEPTQVLVNNDVTTRLTTVTISYDFQFINPLLGSKASLVRRSTIATIMEAGQ